MKIFDTHAHYYDEKFNTLGGAGTVLERIFLEYPHMNILNVGTNNTTSRVCIRQAAKYPGMYAAAGIHPSDSAHLSDFEGEMSRLEELFSDENQRKSAKILAVGEAGLDYYYPGHDKRKQWDYFDAQMQLARKYSLPVIVHNRDAHGDCFEIIKKYPDVLGVFHSYSGSAETAKELNKRGWYISFSGTLTFKNARKVRESAAVCAKNLILIETDAPYLTPHPYRGQINHSGFVTHTANVLASILEISPESAAELTDKNARTLFGIR